MLICAFGHRFTGAGRSRHARGANASWARGGRTAGAGRWKSRRKKRLSCLKEQLSRRKKRELFLGVSVGNGVCGGITLQTKNPRNNFGPRIFLPTNCTNLHEFSCKRVQSSLLELPSAAENIKEISCFAFNGDLFGRTNLTNAMRADDWGMSCGVVPSRHVGLASPIRALRTRLPSLRSVVPSRHLTQVTKALKMFEFV